MKNPGIENEIHEKSDPDSKWLDLTSLVRVKATSESVGFPVEAVLSNELTDSGWKAGEPGEQAIKLAFALPVNLRQLRLVFREDEFERTHEYVLRWSSDRGQTFREIVRQQFNFSPPKTSVEQQLFAIDLAQLTDLEIRIVPDISDGTVCASLSELRVA